MWRRELAIALRAPVTWVASAVAALVVGHGFVLAVDRYGAASRAALDQTSMRKEVDRLAGIARPTRGGCQLAVAVLVAVIAAQLLAVEKERITFGALALAAGSPGRVAAKEIGCAIAAASLHSSYRRRCSSSSRQWVAISTCPSSASLSWDTCCMSFSSRRRHRRRCMDANRRARDDACRRPLAHLVGRRSQRGLLPLSRGSARSARSKPRRSAGSSPRSRPVSSSP